MNIERPVILKSENEDGKISKDRSDFNRDAKSLKIFIIFPNRLLVVRQSVWF